jgi:hypothetical protein
MLATRGDKYRWFLRGLRAFKYVSLSHKRGKFLESYYTLMRYVDDIVDGDAPLPPGYASSEEFVRQKILFAKELANPSDAVDHLMLYCFEVGQGFGQDFSEETADILGSMLFDASRFGKGLIFPEATLEDYFFVLDVRGCIKATLKVFGEDASQYTLLKPLGFATRIYYNLRDYSEDMNAGLINVALEDCQRYGILDLEDRLSQPVQDWMRGQAEKGLGHIEQHRSNMALTDFGLLTRFALPLVYELPSQRYLEKLLDHK